jgi:hypothetical protein
MERIFAKYKRFAGAVFFLWIFLETAKFFGFSFGVDLHLLFRVAFLLGGIWGIGEIWVNWGVIYPALIAFLARQKSEFIDKTKVTQAEIVAFSPRILGGKVGSFVVLPLAVSFGAIRRVGGVGGRFFRLLFSKEGILLLGILGILLDIFVLDFSSDLIILFLTGLWVWSVRWHRFEGRVSVAGALIFLALCPFLLIFKKDPIAEKAAIWAYMFLVVGTIQMFVEYAKEEKKNVKLVE